MSKKNPVGKKIQEKTAKKTHEGKIGEESTDFTSSSC